MIFVIFFLLVISFKFKFGLDLVLLMGSVFITLVLAKRKNKFLYTRRLNKFFSISLLLLFLSFIVSAIKEFPSFEYVIFSAKVFLLMLFSVFVVNYYVISYRKKFLDIIVMHMYYAIALHSLIIIAMFLLPDFRNFIYSYSAVSDNVFNSAGKYRIAGFSGSGSSYLSFFQALGVGISAYLIKFRLLNRLNILSSNLLIAVSILLTGRFGLIVAVLFFVIYCNLFKIEIIIITTTIASIFFAGIVSESSILYLAIDRVLAEFGMNEHISQSQSTFSTVSSMLHFPALMADPINFVLGTSSAGRTDSLWLHSDIGYMRNFFMGGVIGLLAITTFYFMMVVDLCRVYSVTLDKKLQFISVFTLLVVFILGIFNIKEDVLVGRHGFISIFILFVSIIMLVEVEKQGRKQFQMRT